MSSRLRKEYQFELSAVEKAAWSLLFAMEETDFMGRPNDDAFAMRDRSWFEQEYTRLKKALVDRGLNIYPT